MMHHQIFTDPTFISNFSLNLRHCSQICPKWFCMKSLKRLSIQDRCNLAEAHPNFDAMLSDSIFWKKLVMDNDNAFVNNVCHFVFAHSALVSEVIIDNVGSPERSFIASWTDVLLSSLHNIRKVSVTCSTFLTSGLFVTSTPLLTELRLNSCPNLPLRCCRVSCAQSQSS